MARESGIRTRLVTEALTQQVPMRGSSVLRARPPLAPRGSAADVTSPARRICARSTTCVVGIAESCGKSHNAPLGRRVAGSNPVAPTTFREGKSGSDIGHNRDPGRTLSKCDLQLTPPHWCLAPQAERASTSSPTPLPFWRLPKLRCLPGGCRCRQSKHRKSRLTSASRL